MENYKPEEVNAPSRLVRVAIRVEDNGYHFLHELSEQFQEEFSKITTFKIGEPINLGNKCYKIKDIIYFQSNGAMPSISPRVESIKITYYEVEIILHLEVQ